MGTIFGEKIQSFVLGHVMFVMSTEHVNGKGDNYIYVSGVQRRNLTRERLGRGQHADYSMSSTGIE